MSQAGLTRVLAGLSLILGSAIPSVAQTSSPPELPPLKLVVLFRDSETGEAIRHASCRLESGAMVYLADSGMVRMHSVKAGKQRLIAWANGYHPTSVAFTLGSRAPDTLIANLRYQWLLIWPWEWQKRP